MQPQAQLLSAGTEGSHSQPHGHSLPKPMGSPWPSAKAHTFNGNKLRALRMAPEVLSASSCHLQGCPECSAPGTAESWALTLCSPSPFPCSLQELRAWQGCAHTSLHTPPRLQFQGRNQALLMDIMHNLRPRSGGEPFAQLRAHSQGHHPPCAGA